jgi:hypothetical protein
LAKARRRKGGEGQGDGEKRANYLPYSIFRKLDILKISGKLITDGVYSGGDRLWKPRLT